MVLGQASERVVDRPAGWLGAAFVVTLLAGEAALTLPDERATPASVAAFYATHRPVIIGLQLVGFLASVLLAVFAWRLRVVSGAVAAAGLVLAATTLAPGTVTLLLALAADPRRPAGAGRYNALEPRGDDLLFVGIALFATTVAVLLGRRPRWLGVLAGFAALCCLLRLALEALGRDRGPLDALAPVAFLAMIGGLVWLCFQGFPTQRVGSDPVNQG